MLYDKYRFVANMTTRKSFNIGKNINLFKISSSQICTSKIESLFVYWYITYSGFYTVFHLYKKYR